MASRRVRIKAVANIPQRKRAAETLSCEPTISEDKKSPVSDLKVELVKTVKNTQENEVAETSLKEDAINSSVSKKSADVDINLLQNVEQPEVESKIQLTTNDVSSLNNTKSLEQAPDDGIKITDNEDFNQLHLDNKNNNIDQNKLLNIEENKPLSVEENKLLSVQENKLLSVEENKLSSVEENKLLRVEENKLLSVQENNLLSVEENKLLNVEENKLLNADANKLSNVDVNIKLPSPKILIDSKEKLIGKSRTKINIQDIHILKSSVSKINRSVTKINSDCKEIVQNGKYEAQINLPEVHLTTADVPIKRDINPVSDHPKFCNPPSDRKKIEYPPPAASPSKYLNRPRIKAIPRLGQRRASFSIGSASESEEESRKTYTRIRNESICSTTSISSDFQTLDSSTIQKKEFSSVIQRKCKRTEQSRKLAEARRDFMLKFGSNKPDKQKLTMIDLIFYNPATAPMSQMKRHNSLSTSESVSKSEKENSVPPPETVAETSDEENNTLAPQITINANGEIVIDEKSLTIENKELQKNREALKHSELVDGDVDTSYGVYKRLKRSKDWSKSETLRFYKALNTIGTDFTMMCELFPNRNRRELKMKFKKEERMNKHLVDKAIMQPNNFDLTELRKEVAVAELEKLEAEKRKDERKNIRLKKRIARKRTAADVLSGDENEDAKFNAQRHDTDSNSIGDNEREKDKSDQNVVENKGAKLKRKKKRNNGYEYLKKGINSIIDSDSDDCSIQSDSHLNCEDSNEDSSEKKTVSDNDEEEQRVSKVQTTRSGRVSKPKGFKIPKETPPKKSDDENNTPPLIIHEDFTENIEDMPIDIITDDVTAETIKHGNNIVSDISLGHISLPDASFLANLSSADIAVNESALLIADDSSAFNESDIPIVLDVEVGP